MSTAVMPTSNYLKDYVLKTVKTELLQHGGSVSQPDVSGKLSWEDLQGPMDTGSPGQQESLMGGRSPTGHHGQPQQPNMPFSIATLLDNLMVHQHRRLDRTQSEPSKTSNLNVVNTSRYKTELCRPYEESGACKYGDKCQFAHGEHELRGLVRHPKYKTELCRTFHTVGFCPYGPRCHFIHNADEARGSVAKFRPRPLSLDTSPASSLGSVSPPPNSPPPPPVSPDTRLPVFNRISAPNSPFFPTYSPPFMFRELLA